MSAKNKKLLIVEDERPIANILQLKLQEEGIDVTVASDGREALDALKDNNFSLCILDLVMPDVDGFTVLEEMKKRNDKTPVIVSSNLTQEKDKEKVRAFGVKGYVEKSDTGIWQMIDKIKEFLDAA